MSNKEIVAGFFEEAYTKKNYDYVMKYFSENYIDHSPAGARSNKDAVGILKVVHEMFSDLKVTVLDVFEENDMVATRIEYEGIHISDCMGIPATGKKIKWEALENFRVENKIVTESWGYWPDAEIKKMLRD
jgi:predicted ester cyclase